jgi:hypothetical protein
MSLDPIGAASELSTAAEFEALILEELQRALGFELAFFAYAGAVPTVVGLEPARLAAAFEPGNRYERELMPVKQAALTARGVAIDTQVLGERRVRATAYFNDFAKPVGGKHAMMACLTLRGRFLGGLLLGRTHGSFGSQEVARLEGLLPALAVARASFGLPGLVSSPLRSEGGWPWRRAKGRLADGELTVRDRPPFREMVARSAATGAEMVWSRSALDDPSRSGWPYVDLFHVACALARRRERALFIGAGAAVAPRQFARSYPGIWCDVVEPELAVVQFARQHFGADEIPHLRFHPAEGAAFIAAANPSSWDVVVVDAYDANDLATGIGSRRFFTSLARVLRPGGAFAFNVIGSLEPGSTTRTVIDAASSVFDDLRVVPVMTSGEQFAPSTRRNVVLIGRL